MPVHLALLGVDGLGVPPFFPLLRVRPWVEAGKMPTDAFEQNLVAPHLSGLGEDVAKLLRNELGRLIMGDVVGARVLALLVTEDLVEHLNRSVRLLRGVGALEGSAELFLALRLVRSLVVKC